MSEIRLKIAMNEPRKAILNQFLLKANEDLSLGYFNLEETARNLSFTQIWNKSLKESGEILSLIQTHIALQLFAIARCLAQAPGFWIQMLLKQQIEMQKERVFILNQSITLTIIYRRIVETVNGELGQGKNFEEMYVDENNKLEMAEFLTKISSHLVQHYDQEKKIIEQRMADLEAKLDVSKIMNSYLLVATLKQISSSVIEESTKIFQRQLFRAVPQSITLLFCQFTMENYEVITLKALSCILPIIMSDDEMQQICLEKKNRQINYLHNTEQNKIEKNCLSIPQADKEKARPLSPCPKQKRKKQSQLQPLQKQTISRQFQKTLYENKEYVNSKMLSYSSPTKKVMLNVGGTVGECLANINNYSDANHFLKDISKKTIVNGSINYMVVSIPIVKFFFLAGGLSHTFYHTFTNEVTSNSKKLEELGYTSMTTMGAVGTTIAGITLGQVLIPIPFVGAFIGGVIGGFFGSKGGNRIRATLSKNCVNSVIKYLREHVKEERYWDFSYTLLSTLGIDLKYFEQTNPRKKHKDYVWLTAVCYCLVCCYQSRRRLEFTEKKLVEYEKNKAKTQQVLENEFDIVKIANFLTQMKLDLLAHFPTVELLIHHLLV